MRNFFHPKKPPLALPTRVESASAEETPCYRDNTYKNENGLSLRKRKQANRKQVKIVTDPPQSSRRYLLGTVSLGIVATSGVAMLFQQQNQIAYASLSRSLSTSSAVPVKTASAGSTYNVKDYGAVGNGHTDDTNAITAAISAAASAGGGDVILPGGALYLISSPLSLSTFGVRLVGTGGSVLQPSANFSGTQIIGLSADFCGVRDLMIAFANTATNHNPIANGIQITGARSCLLENIALNYINGWAIQSSSTSNIANYWTNLTNIHTFQCAQGIHILGNAGSAYNVGHYLVNCNTDQCSSGDGFQFEDSHDILCSNTYGTVTSGPGTVLHIVGASAAIYMRNVDLGTAPGPADGPTVLIESGVNGTPKQIEISGIVEGGSSGVTISAGTLIHLNQLEFFNNGTYGLNITGGDGILIQGCSFSANGSAGFSGRYDFQSSTSGHVKVDNCIFTTPQGSNTSMTNNAVNVTSGNVIFQNTAFLGAGYNPVTIFKGYPIVVRTCPGYNPLGKIVDPAIGPSPYTPPTQSTDMTVFLSGGIVSSVAIGGAVTGLTSGTFRIPAQQTITITYSVSPSWVWFGD